LPGPNFIIGAERIPQGRGERLTVRLKTDESEFVVAITEEGMLGFKHCVQVLDLFW
jgi:hypothetical protein